MPFLNRSKTKANAALPWIPVLLVLAVGAAVRLYGIGARCLWLDEAMSASLLDYGPIEIIRRCSEPLSVHPPLYFVVLKFWSDIAGTTEVALRGLSCLFGLAIIIGVYLVMRRLERFHRKPVNAPSVGAFAAAAVVALNPMQIELSQTVRGYTLAMACLTFAAWALLDAVRDTRRGGPWLAAALLALAACYTHHVAIFSVAAASLFAFMYLLFGPRPETTAGSPVPSRWATLRWPALRWPAIALILFSAGYLLPWLSRLVAQSETIRHDQSSSWLITFEVVTTQILHAAYSSYDVGWSVDEPTRLSVFIILSLLLTYLTCLGGWGGRFIVAVGLIPPLLLAAYSLRSERCIFHARYLCFAELAWWCSAAYAIDEIRDRRLRYFLTSYLIIFMAYACYDSWAFLGRSAKPGMQGAIQFVLDHRDDDEPIVADTPFAYFTAKYCAHEKTPVYLCAKEAERDHVWGSEHYGKGQLVTADFLATRPPPGVWILSTRSYSDSLTVQPKIPVDMKLVQKQSFTQNRWLEKPVVVSYYRRAAVATPTAASVDHQRESVGAAHSTH